MWLARLPVVLYPLACSVPRELAELRQRIELIQDFSMPTSSTGIQVSADGQYILATGTSSLVEAFETEIKRFLIGGNCVRYTRWVCCAPGVYKPRVRCYDVNQLSMKFERCLDAEGTQEVVSCSVVVFIFVLA